MGGSVYDFSVLAPVGFVSIGAMLVLMIEAVLSRKVAQARENDRGGEQTQSPVAGGRIGGVLAGVASFALVLAIYTAAELFAKGGHASFYSVRPMLSLDPLSSFAIVLLGVASLLSVWLSITYLPALHIDHGEYYALLLLSTAGMFVLVSSVDFMALFVGLELMSIPIYALAGFDRKKLRSNESALKYFLTGAFASGILLYGMALVYGATGHIDFEGIRAGFAAGGPLALAGLALIVVGFAFKMSVVPFHQWAPDVYEGAPVSVTAFMAVAVKAAAVVTLLRFLAFALPEDGERLNQVLWVLALLTMLVGNFMAVIQSDVKRLLAYSSVAHAGYLLIGFVAATPASHTAVLFYLVTYLFMTLGAFGVVVALTRGGREFSRIEDFAGLARRRPGVAALMTLFMLSLAGIPGTAGFMAKFYLFSAAVNADLIVLVIVAVLASVVSVFYYLRLPVAMYMHEPSDEEPAEMSSSELTVLAVCAVAVLFIGFFPNSDVGGGILRLLDIAGKAAGVLQ
jgi:NADH-quinone oxidoreductase subunit N